MVAAPEINGGGSEWPDLDVAVDLPEPKEHYSDREMAQTYATLAVHHGMLWPRVRQALEYLKEHFFAELGRAHKALEDSAKAMESHSKEVRLLKEAVLGQRAAAELSLPPMRPELPSAVATAESIKSKVSGVFEQIAKETKGPRVEADPKRLADIVGQAVDEEMARREAAQNAKRDADELEARRQADVNAKKNRRKLVKAMVFAFAAAMAGAAGTWTWGKAQGVAEESRRHPAPALAPAPPK
jgi:hypothetical protein